MNDFVLENVNGYSNLIFSKINNMLIDNYQRLIKLDFSIIENKLFLYVEMENGLIKEKNIINIELEDISIFYYQLYKVFIEKYLEDENNKISIIKEINLINYQEPYLNLHIKNNIHKSEINIYLKNIKDERKVLDEIERDWINMIEEKKSNRIR